MLRHSNHCLVGVKPRQRLGVNAVDLKKIQGRLHSRSFIAV